MKKMSLQWRLTCIITLYIAVICGCVTMFVYKNGVYYMDSLQEAVDTRGDDQPDDAEEIYISIPEDKWDEFANDFSVQVYNNKADYRKNSLIISAVLALLGGVATYFISGHALRPIREFSDKIEKVQAQNLADSRIEENQVKELNQLSVSYNKMLERLSEAFKLQRQFTANAAHELRTPLAVMQLQIDLYNSSKHPDNDTSAQQTISMITEQTERLSKMVRTLLDMSELQTIARDEEIAIAALVEEVLADLEPLAQEKGINLIEKCDNVLLMGSDILIYRLVYNLVENGIKYNRIDGSVTGTTAYDYADFPSGVTYYYTVVAYGEAPVAGTDSPVYSNQVAKAAKVTADGINTVTLKNSKKGKVTVTFNTVPGAKKYTVYRSMKKGGKYTKVATVKVTKKNKNKKSYTGKAVKKKTYYYKVVAEGTNELKADMNIESAVKKIKVKK